MPNKINRDVRIHWINHELPEFGGDIERIKRVFDAIDAEYPDRRRHTRAFRLYMGLAHGRAYTLKEVGDIIGVGPERARQLWLAAARVAKHPYWQKIK